MKKKQVLASLLAAMILAGTMTAMPTEAEELAIGESYAPMTISSSTLQTSAGDIAIDETNFPDPIFRAFLSNEKNWGGNRSANIETKGSMPTAPITSLTEKQRDDVTRIDCGLSAVSSDESKIKLLTGIEKFTNLTNLNCGYNQLTSLDLTQNTKLTELDCTGNPLSDLDLSQNIELTMLRGLGCDLKNLDLTQNTKLEICNLFENRLENLDLSQNKELKKLSLGENQLTSLDVSNNTELTELNFYYNQVSSLDLINNTKLTKLNCHYNQLTSLDVSNNTELTILKFFNNQVTSLDVSKNTALEELDCSNNQLTSLDLSENTQLTNFICKDNKYYIKDGGIIPKGFVKSKASNIQGGTIDSSGKVTFDKGSGEITYDYDCGNGKSATFKLINDISATPTAPTTPVQPQPEPQTVAEPEVEPAPTVVEQKADTLPATQNGTTVLTEEAVKEALSNGKDEKDRTGAKAISIVAPVKLGKKGGDTAKLIIEEEALDLLTDRSVKDFTVRPTKMARVTLDRKAIRELEKLDSDIVIEIVRVKSSEKVEERTDNEDAYEVRVYCKDGEKLVRLDDFKGKFIVKIPHELKPGQSPRSIKVAYEVNGKVHFVKNLRYNAKEKEVYFRTDDLNRGYTIVNK